MKISATLAFCAALICISASALDSYTLPDGRVLENPYIISQTPAGLNVGHSKGVIFVKFSSLPEDIQKKFNYDPQEALKHESRMAAVKAAAEQKKKDDAVRLAAEQEQRKKLTATWKSKQLAQEIGKLEIRNKFIEEEIPKLEKEIQGYLDKSHQLAGTNVSGNKNSSDYSYGWGWGGTYVHDASGSRAEKTKRKMISDLTDEYASAKKTLKKYKDELNKNRMNLLTLRQNLEQSQKTSHSEE